jgi:outer membrane protein OmpA-like peptidoglycan-associated protein
VPLNTQYDDFALITKQKSDTEQKGYFSSNRPSGKGGDDIYAVDILKMDIGKKIKGIASGKAGYPLPATFITLLDEKNNVVDTVTTKDDGAFVFLVDSNMNFTILGKKESYSDGTKSVNTMGQDFIINGDIFLQKKEDIIVAENVPENIEEQLKVGQDLGKILKFNPDRIFFDLDKFDIRKDAEVDLAYIVKIMNDHPNMVVELGAHTDCRAGKGYNQRLSDKRAKSSADYIKKRISNPDRISGKGYGETRLTNSCACEDKTVSDCSDAEHQKNRRTEFIIVQE